MSGSSHWGASPNFGLLERERELDRLETLLAGVADGEGRFLLVEGEAGIGKTALLDALAARAGSLGATVLRARGGELERDFPHGVVRQLFEPVVHHGGARDPLRGAAARAAPVLGLMDDTGARPVESDASLAANHGLYWLAANLAEDAMLVVVVDDGQWADAPSLLFLHYLGRRLEGVPVLVTVGLRTAEPGSRRELLDALRDLDRAEIVRPAPLSADATAQVIRALAGEVPSAPFVSACQEATNGNPFLLRELLLAVGEEHAQLDGEAASRVRRLGPRSISRSVLGRLGVLWPQAVALARAVAVLDTDAELAHAAALAQIDLSEAATAADALTEAQVLAPGRPLRFRHPIIRHAVYQDLPERRRGLDHARAAAILMRAGQPDRAAVHLLATDPAGDPTVVERLRAAARRALLRGAPAAAVAFLDRALAEPPRDDERASTLLELGRAARLAGDPAAPEHLRAALAQTGELASRVEAARELGAALTATGHVREAVDALEEVADGLPADATQERFMLEAELLTASVFHDELASRAADRIEHLLPRATGTTPAERVLLVGAAFHRVAAGTATGDEIAALAQAATNGALIVQEQSAAALYPNIALSCLLFTDRHEAASALLDALSADARKRGSPAAFAWYSTMRSRYEHMRGNPAAAEAHARAALELFPAGLTLSTEMTLSYVVFAAVEQGRLDAGEDALRAWGAAEGPLSATTSGLTLLLARSALRLDQGRIDDAVADAEEVVRREATRGGSLPGRGFRWTPLLALHAAGNEEQAIRLAEEDLADARRFGVRSAEGIARLVLGVVAGGRTGLEQLEQAVTLLERSPRRLDHAHALVAHGAALRRAKRRGDAREPLGRGMDLAHRLGAAALAQRARVELQACGARPRRLVLTGVESLTASERRVARMAADGLSNPEIAQALFVTRKTVEAHLASAYRKLDIASRDRLADALGEAAS